MYPDLSAKVISRMNNTKMSTDRKRQGNRFYLADAVNVMNFQGKPNWMSGVLEEQLAPVTFLVRLEDGRVGKRHVDHICVNTPTDQDKCCESLTN